jgi:hypothetical protein
LSVVTLTTSRPQLVSSTDTAPPSQPADAAWTDSNGVVTQTWAAQSATLYASWSASTDADSGVKDYRIQLAEDDPTFGAPLVDRYTGSTSTFATFSSTDGVRFGHGYYFRVLGRDNALNESTWSVPSNQVRVTDETTGPAVAHAPVMTGFVDQDIPVALTATCGGAEQTCSARLFWRVTPITGTAAVFAGGWTRVDLTRGAQTQLNGNRSAWDWAGTIPGTSVSTSGIDYYLEAEDTGALTQFPGGTFVGSQYAVGVQPAAHTFHHVHVVSPPIVTHAPPPFGQSGQDLPLSIQVACYTSSCSATAWYHTTDGPITDQPLLALPNWPHATMNQTAAGTPIPGGGNLLTFGASVPAAMVDTRGVDYFFQVTDGVTTTFWPGSPYAGYYAPTDGMRTAYHHTHVLETPHIVHQPTLTSPYRQPVPVDAQATCTGTTGCSATLYYRTTVSDSFSVSVNNGNVTLDTTSPFASTPMTVTPVTTANGITVIAVHGIIPASFADTRGVDYFFSVTDGPTTTWWPGTSSVDGYVPLSGVHVGWHHTRVLDPPHFIHAPTTIAPALQNLTIETQLTCATAHCDVTLHYARDPLAATTAIATVPMTLVGSTTATPAGQLGTYRGVIPGADVTTAGLAYWMQAFDGYTNSYQPGTSYEGAYVPVDGTRTGAHVVHVLEPPHVVHAPVATSYHAQPITIDVHSNCATGTCVATLHWRTSGHDWKTSTMTVAGDEGTSPAGHHYLYRAVIPGSDATTEGVDYWAEVNDSYVTDQTPTYHATVLAPTAVIHTPVLVAPPNTPLTIEAEIPCSTPTCTATLYYRTPGQPLLGEPAWKTLTMNADAPGVALGDATTVSIKRAVIPAADMTTQGVEYFIKASDGVTTAYSPGTAYTATQYTRVDGVGVHYWSVHVLEPVRIVHTPAVTASAGNPIDVTATVNCATRNCSAVLNYRGTGTLANTGQFVAYLTGGKTYTQVTMTQTVIQDLGANGTVLRISARIPGTIVQPDGVDYWFGVTDGTTHAYYPGTTYLSPAGAQDGIQAAWHHVTVTGQRTTGTIGDLIWVDRNANGTQQLNEPGLPGVKVTLVYAGLDGNFGTVDDVNVATQNTDITGSYSFQGLLPLKYRVVIDPTTLPAGLTMVSGTNPSAAVTLATGQLRNDIDFGYRYLPLGTAAVHTYADNNVNNTIDTGEADLVNVSISLKWAGPDDTFGTADDTTYGPLSTNASGVATLSSLPDGYFHVLYGNTTVPDSGVLASGPTPDPLQLAPLGTGSARVGFHYLRRSSVTVHVFADDNLNGTADAGEAPLSGVNVSTRWAGPDGVFANSDDVVFGPVATHGSGDATIAGVPEGNHRIEFDASTVPDGGRVTTGPRPDPVGVPAAGSASVQLGFHYLHRSTVTVHAYADDNRSGATDPDEAALSGVAVRVLWLGPDGIILTSDDQYFGPTTTNASGDAVIANIPDGRYAITFDQPTVPDAGRLVTGPTPAPLDVPPSAAASGRLGFAFLHRSSLTVGARVDSNGDGQADSNESPAATVSVSARWHGPDGQVNTADDETFGPFTTGANGDAAFGSLPEGTYTVTYDSATAPSNTAPVPGHGIVTLTIGPHGTALAYLGFRYTGHIDVVLWDDTNNNNQIDTGETRRPGATVIVSAPGPDGVLRTADDIVIGTKTTDANGDALFEYLTPGLRRVVIAGRLDRDWTVTP